MAVMDIQVSARRAGTVSVSEGVLRAQQIIEASGLKHILHPMGTCVEGEPAQLYELASRIHAALEEMGFDRVGIAIKLDDRRDKPQSMADKLARIAELSGEKKP